MSAMLHHLRRAALLAGGAELTDAELLRRFVGGRDQAALELLVRRHGPMVWGVCRRVLAGHPDAEDAFQATFLVLLRRAGSIRSRDRLAQWLYGVARQTALKARAKAARRAARERQVAVMPEPGRGRPAPRDDLLPVLDEELGRLPEKYRAAVVLCDLEGKTRQEAARELGCPEGTVASRLARARVLLARRLRVRGLVVSGGALAAVLAREAGPAGVPTAVMSSTIKAVSLVAAGKAAVSGVCSARATALTEGVLKAMLLTKVRTAALVLGLLTVGALGTLGSASRSLQARGEQPPAGTPAEPPQDATGGKGAAAPGKRETKPRAYVIEPPDILLMKYAARSTDDPVKIDGQRLVRPDGTISLGQLGIVAVSGRTPDEARGAIAEHLARRLDGFDPRRLTVDVAAYNSKFFYVIVEDADGGEQVYRFPCTADETVRDAVLQVNGLPAEALRKHIWVARPAPAGRPEQILPVDWKAITKSDDAVTNYQLLPGDRVYVKKDGPNEAKRGSAGPVRPGTDTERLQGTWEVIETRSDGETRPVPKGVDGRLVIEGDEFRLVFLSRPTKSVGGGPGGWLLLATFRLNTTKSPRNIDLITSRDREAHELCLGIYKLDGDDLVICLPREKPGERRPTEFTAEKGSGQEIYKLRRARPEKE